MFGKPSRRPTGSRLALLHSSIEKRLDSFMAPVRRRCPPMSYWVETGRVDIFLYYCTAAIAAQRRTPQLKVVPFPAELAVVAEYGLTVLHSEPDREARAAQLALYLLSSGAQATLRKYGFIASGVAQSASAP